MESRFILAAVIEFPDHTARRLNALWRERLADAYRRYLENRNDATKAEYLQTLRAYAGLILRSEIPEEPR